MSMQKIMHLLRMTDSTFPVGTFSFSNGLETASYIGLVHDKDSLEQYTASAARQAAFSDGVACLMSHRAALAGDYERIVGIDHEIMLFKMNDEARMMLSRMGKKLAELAVKLFPDDKLFPKWLEDIKAGKTPGSYPVAQGIAFAIAGVDEEDLFASHQYGVINMILSAALRCVRVSHYDTQEILLRLSEKTDEYYNRAKTMTFNDMNAFVPEMDIMASMHEKGNMRMFMN
ncbi:MAG: urease accessory protein UreF [Muribaculaceae bacterium]|nr:urease accessory protein UreF [Muribaculaceae bacterium]